MSDILLSFGVQQGEADVKRIRDGIDSILSNLDRNPPKVRVGLTVDDSAIAHFKSQLSSVMNAINLNNGAPITINISGLGEITTEAGRAKSALGSVADAARDVSKATKEAANKSKQSSSDAIKDAKDSAREEANRQSLIKQSVGLINKMRDAEKNWTAAKNGRSKSAYEDIIAYKDQLESLHKQYLDGNISTEQFKTRLSQLSTSFATSASQIRDAGEQTKTFSERLSGLAAKFSTWLSVSQVIMLAVRAVKQMVSTVIELDTAMTELKKVTDESDATYARFLDGATDRAKKLGASISDTVTATADFARLGYGIDDASKLADTAIIYKNIGDGIENIADASESIISTMQAFGVEASDAMSIVDKFNEVGNNFAISSAGIGDAMQRSAAAMNSANNTIDETIALITAANTIVQNPESVGTTMKTISMYLRAAKTDAEAAGESTDGMANSISELRKEILDLTGQQVDIQIDENTFKSTYQILKELSYVWEDITDVSQANLLELIGGKRNANVVSALLENFSVAEDALQSSVDAAGSAVAENEKHLDSIKGKIAEFTAQFESLSKTFIDSEFVKGVVEFGTFLLQIVEVIGDVINALGGLNTVLAVTIGLLVTSKIGSFGSILTNMLGKLSLFINDIAGIGPVFRELKADGVGTFSAISQALDAVGISASSAQVALGAMMLVIGIAISAYKNIKQAQEEARQEAISQAKIASELSGEISGLASQYIELSEAVKTDFSAKESLIQSQDALIEKLGIEQYELDKLIEKYGDLSLAILNASKEKLQMSEFDIREGISARAEELLGVQKELYSYLSMPGNLNSYISMPGIGSFTEGLGLFPTDEDYAKLEKFTNDTQAAFEALNKASMLGAGAFKNASGDYILDLGFDLNSVEGIVDAHAKLGEMLRIVDDAAGQNNAIFSELNSLYNGLDEAVGNYTDSVGELNKNLAQQYVLDEVIDNGVPETQEDFESYRQSVIDAAIASGDFVGSAEQVGSAIDGVLKSDVSFAKFYTDAVVKTATTAGMAAEQLQEEINAINEGIDSVQSRLSTLTNAFSKLKDGTLGINDVVDLLQQFPELSTYVDLTADGFGNLERGLKDLSGAVPNEMIEELLKFKTTNDLTEEQKLHIDSLCEALKNLPVGSFADSIPDLSKTVTELKSAYDILNTAQKEMANGGLTAETIAAMAKETDDYINYLYEENGVVKLNTAAWKMRLSIKMQDNIGAIKDEIAYLEEENNIIQDNLSKLNSNRSALPEKEEMIAEYTAELKANTTAIEDNQAKLGVYDSLYASVFGNLDAYSTTLQNFTNIDSAITSVSNSLTTVADLQKAVANGFTLSLDKALEFARVYPEILNKASVASDGQIALNKDVVNAFIKGKEAELKSQIDAEIAKLEGDKAVLKAKMEFAQAQLDLAKSVGEGEGQISLELAQYRVNAGNAVAQALIQAGVDEATAYQLACAAMAQNSEEFNRVAALVCTDMAGNFDKAAYSSAQSIYNNMRNAASNLDGVIRAAHNAAKAIAGVGSGTQSGSTGSFSGSGGVRSGGISVNTTSGSFNGTNFSYDPKTVSLEKFIADLELDISSYSKAIAQIDGQITTLKALRNKSLDEFATPGKNKKSGSKSGSSKSSSKSNWFEQEYALHQHLLKMDAENVEDYLDWLNTAYKKAYKQGIISLDDYYKYQEEVYKGLQDLFKDYLNDVEHEISMRENYDGEAAKIISLYKEMIKAIEKEIKAARSQGLDDTDDYIQELQNKWQDYTSTIEEMQNSATEAAKDALSELVDYRIDMLEQESEKEKDALDNKLDALKSFYDKQKELLQDQYDEEKYLEERQEKRDTVSSIKEELDMLEYDDSAWAQKRKFELQEELAQAEKDLSGFEKDHALDTALGVLDDAYNIQAEQLEAEMNALEERLNDPAALYNQALNDIKNNTGNLYQEMLEYNRKHGTGNDEDVKDVYEEAYKALLEYKNIYGKDYEGVVLSNSTNYSPDPGSWDTEVISGTNPANQPKKETSTNKTTSSSDSTKTTKKSPPKKGSSVTVKKSATHYGSKSGGKKMASFVPGGKYTAYKVSGSGSKAQVLIGRNGTYTGWVKLSDLVGYRYGTDHSIGGFARFDEAGKGSEYIFESSDGNRYRMFAEGSKVLNADATDFLYKFATTGGGILAKMLDGILNLTGFNNVSRPIQAVEIHTGDIVVQGNANERTISEIRRAQRDSINYVIKEFNKLNK